MALTTGLTTTTPPPPTGARRRPQPPTLGGNPLGQQSMQILQQGPGQARYTPAPGFGTPMNAAGGSSAAGVSAGTAGYGGGSTGYGSFSGQTDRTPNVSVVAGAGPYNAEMARLAAINRVRTAESPGFGAMTGADASAREYERANQFAERNSASGQMRLRDELDRRTREEIARRTEAQQRNAQMREDELLANQRAQQVSDRNAAQSQRTFEALLNAGAFGTATPASLGTDRRGLNLSALAGALPQSRGVGGGLSMPGTRTGGLSVGQTGALQTGDPGLATRIGETPADRYWAAKRANDLEGEQIALQNARTQQQWAAMDRGVYGGGSFGGGRSNASGSGVGGGSGTAGYDPGIYDPMLSRLMEGMSGPTDVEMPAAPPAVAAPKAEQVDDSAAFGRARSRIGQGTTASLRSLQDAMTARGISGSGIEGRLMADVYGQGLGALGEASRDAAIEQINRDQQVADMGYQGALTQRGQDLGYLNNTVATRLANANRRDDWTTRQMAARQALQGLTFGASLRY